MVSLYHVNFHTLGSRPLFEQQDWDSTIRSLIADVLLRHSTLCPAWEVMPTHVHLIVHDFEDLPRSRLIHQLKGATAHGFFGQYPFLRQDLLGGHLWMKGYYWTAITSQRQYRATVDYIRNNRSAADLEPPMPLSRHEAG
jgi:REP element-mobilizing transposase RayT